jgi:hypothetical protein
MTQVIVNGNTYSDDGSSSKDMRNGGHRQWLLPMISDTMVVINSILGGSFVVSFTLVRPTTGQTITAGTGLGAFVIDPAGTIATLNVGLPPGPTEGQIFELSTSQAITTITVTSPDVGHIVQRGTDLLAPGGGMSWRYSAADTTWHRRF